MKIQKYLLLFALLIPMPAVFAQCDLKHFRWGCDIPIHPNHQHYRHSLVYCGNSHGYITASQYDQLSNYTRRSINMVLTIDGEYMDSPCIPARR